MINLDIVTITRAGLWELYMDGTVGVVKLITNSDSSLMVYFLDKDRADNNVFGALIRLVKRLWKQIENLA